MSANSLCLLQVYYASYLRDVRHLSERSISHYYEALKWISRFLKKKGLIQENIYEVSDLATLQSLRDVLYSDAEFQELNKAGHQMYSAGLNNYLRFTEGHDFESTKPCLTLLDKPITVPETEVDKYDTWRRSSIIRDQVLIAANYECEINPLHKTFISKETNHQYVEGHHIIGLSKQSVIPNSLDIYANIICLCPICHRFLHYGTVEAKLPIVRNLYRQRSDRFAKSGIKLSQNEFECLVL